MNQHWRTVGEIYASQGRDPGGRFLPTAGNPFKDRNATKISQAIKRNPTEARRLCEAAGDNWRDYTRFSDDAAGAEERRREHEEKIRRTLG